MFIHDPHANEPSFATAQGCRLIAMCASFCIQDLEPGSEWWDELAIDIAKASFLSWAHKVSEVS